MNEAGGSGVRPVGRRGLLVAVADPAGAAARLADAAAGAGVVLAEVVPGAETVLVVATTDRASQALRDLVAAALNRHAAPASQPGPGAENDVVDIPVRYDGPDLDAVAEHTGLTPEAVVAAHSGAAYRGAFSGFAPGFCYLDGLPEALRVPRRDEPRTRVPAGAVAVADRYTAVYPRPSPGGWQLLGTTTERLWDSSRTPPARIRPGTAVRFHPVP